jgi:sugar lactone lactonase YvrE
MQRVLMCPSCSAPLRYTEGNAPTIVCAFCGSSIVVPKEWRLAEAGPVPISPAAGKKAGIYILLTVSGLALIMIVLAWVMRPRSDPSDFPPKPAPTQPADPKPADPKPVDPGFATTVLKFGGDGIGPGLFKDARSVAVDATGNIYVAEYMQRRIQVFDSEGKFVTQWMVGPQMETQSMAADRKGTVYIQGSGTIWRFEGSTGKELGHLDYPGGARFDDIAITPDGGLIASEITFEDDLVRFDTAGKTRLIIRKAVSTQSETGELDLKVATDGVGHIYALSTFSNAVYKFSTDGKYVSKFGNEGDQPGQFRAPMAIAVDGQGRVYVSDIRGIQVFDADGRYLDKIDSSGQSLGMVFDDKNDLLVAARDQVIKFAIKKP